jgi:16S rRNA (adenine1518-N6/adenine1519-N6)-dimethyltransferase
MLSDTLQILNNNHIKLDKRKGQNYLINRDTLHKIIEHADLSPNDVVLEIGPGIGTLTIPMASEVKKIIAIEQDHKIAGVLKKRLNRSGINNVEVIVADAVKTDFPKFNKVVSNLPYQISSPITFKILKHDFDFAILMYQLEFAKRMIAEPGNSNYSRLSLMLYYCADTELLFKVPSEDFYPQPKISSAVVKLNPNKKVDLDENLINVSRALFQHKKKKTRNALLDSFHEITDLDKKDAKEIVESLDRDLMDKRVLKLTPDEVLLISKKLLFNIKKDLRI